MMKRTVDNRNTKSNYKNYKNNREVVHFNRGLTSKECDSKYLFSFEKNTDDKNYAYDGDISSYTAENITTRKMLLNTPEIQKMLKLFWNTYNNALLVQ